MLGRIVGREEADIVDAGPAALGEARMDKRLAQRLAQQLANDGDAQDHGRGRHRHRHRPRRRLSIDRG